MCLIYVAIYKNVFLDSSACQLNSSDFLSYGRRPRGVSFVLLGTQSDWGDIWWTKGDENVGVGLEGLTERQIVTSHASHIAASPFLSHEPADMHSVLEAS